MNKKKVKSESKCQPFKISKLGILIDRAKKYNEEFYKSVEQLEIVKESIKPIREYQNRIEEEEVKQVQEERLVSAKWLITLKPNLQNDLDLIYQDETEIDQIVKFQLKERINKQKETQKKQYFGMLEELGLENKHAVYDDKIKEGFQCTYQYTSLGKIVQLDIKYFDFLKLNPQNYVNDTIINFFLRFLENEIFRNPQVLIYNTYFSAKLMQFANEQKQMYSIFLQNNNSLQKWNKEDIFTKQYLLFPLHLKEHWAVLFVVNPLGICQQLLNKQSQKQGMFIYFDSLLIFDPRITMQIKFYLLHVWNTTNKQLSNDQIYQLAQTQITMHQPIVPRQTNLVDCGLYMLEYVERFLQNPNYILCNLEKDNLEWFPKIIIFIKRILIKKILYGLNQGQKDNAERYQNNCKQIDVNYNKPEQFDKIDENLLEQLQVSRLQFYLSEEYNYYYEGN